ncbi:hypothetical protein V22_34770 [Calycomorphotria hydatis]|uniref:Uncharacterized protein n=1 Tax=Calycomorphotria hydatis TaxID=2528027 RepID=A0A517TCW8_9PLAN|nr:hypothetical protein V22_34770 [Calycomorphotria hydatis]
MFRRLLNSLSSSESGRDWPGSFVVVVVSQSTLVCSGESSSGGIVPHGNTFFFDGPSQVR